MKTEEQRLKYNAYMREWCRTHRASVKASQKRTIAKNPEKYKEIQRKKYLRWKTEKPERLKEITTRAGKKFALKKVWLLPENKIKNKERSRLWRLNHPGEVTKRVHEWRTAHPEETRENRRKWARENTEKNIICHKNNAMKRRGAEGICTLKEWRELKEIYGYTCPSCGRKEPEIKLSVDHIIPLTKGGTNYIENIQPLCMPCNSKKNNKEIRFAPIKRNKNML